MKDHSLTSKSLHYILLGIIGLLVIGLIGGTYLANTVLDGQAKRLLDSRTKGQALQRQQEQLARTKADIEKYKSLASIAKGIVPQDKDQANTIREIVRLAAASNVQLGGITFPTSTLGGPAVASATPGATTPAPAKSTGKPALSQLKPAPGLSGVYSMPITVTSDTNKPVPYDRFISFLAGLEKNRRTALVSAITLQPNPQSPGTVGFTLTIDEYIKP